MAGSLLYAVYVSNLMLCYSLAQYDRKTSPVIISMCPFIFIGQRKLMAAGIVRISRVSRTKFDY